MTKMGRRRCPSDHSGSGWQQLPTGLDGDASDSEFGMALTTLSQPEEGRWTVRGALRMHVAAGRRRRGRPFAAWSGVAAGVALASVASVSRATGMAPRLRRPRIGPGINAPAGPAAAAPPAHGSLVPLNCRPARMLPTRSLRVGHWRAAAARWAEPAERGSDVAQPPGRGHCPIRTTQPRPSRTSTHNPQEPTASGRRPTQYRSDSESASSRSPVT
jgi:hypothetical protein